MSLAIATAWLRIVTRLVIDVTEVASARNVSVYELSGQGIARLYKIALSCENVAKSCCYATEFMTALGHSSRGVEEMRLRRGNS